jgi:hypothetical protein
MFVVVLVYNWCNTASIMCVLCEIIFNICVCKDDFMIWVAALIMGPNGDPLFPKVVLVNKDDFIIWVL